MRDVLIIPFNGEESIVLASDNSGAIGSKDMDFVHVPYEKVAYYCFRVAVMECMAASAQPFAITVQNFCGEDAWSLLLNGINQGIDELGLEGIQINGSTESNFTLLQSALGITVLGKKNHVVSLDPLLYSEETKLGVIGSPLVGDEVVERAAEIAPLALFKRLCDMRGAVLLPVGSKGILAEINRLFSNQSFDGTEIKTNLDIHKSSGPSTCFIAVFPPAMEREIKMVAGPYFHGIEVIKC
ncbi:hypothetical protein [Cytobacillus dafuensis]|uniref:ATP-binding protein n=1 Tax=Cytobacillus dafuensis TaxID=1742359 RepID=A0A5B8Z409_CYTDA|nr:hypothetical protein [Cytobacillus dafuensis]QED46349.1 ATP-binding protein [Cytobacillus dafuensis]